MSALPARGHAPAAAGERIDARPDLRLAPAAV